MWAGRQRELLSDKEWVALFFALSMEFLVDLLEQFPLSLAPAEHELSRYTVDASQVNYPGTTEIAERLGIKHPKTSEGGTTEKWVMTTDFLLVLKVPAGKFELVAVSVKLDTDISQKRTRQLLQLEREYWLSRGASWLLITPSLYDKRVGLRLRDTMPWALENLLPETDLQLAAAMARDLQGHSLTYILNLMCDRFGDLDHAQRAFWQAVWCGKIPLDLRRGWRPHQPVTLITVDEFQSLNPIASRRTAWN
jgi:hypothetical protein